MQRSLTKISDTNLAFVVALVGITSVGVGLATSAAPFSIAPALDGALTAAQLGFVISLLHGLSYRQSLKIMTPVLGILAMATLFQHESAFAIIGVTLTIYGVIGIGLSWIAERAKLAY